MILFNFNLILIFYLYLGWTMSSQLNVYNLNSGELHHQFRYHEGILGHRLGKTILHYG